MTVAVGWKGLPTFVLFEADVTRDSDGLVRVPYRLPDGHLHNVRMFAPSGRCWWEPRGLSLIPFGLDRQWREGMRRYRCLAITEGESDALALDAALGAEGLDVLGVPGASTWKPEWAAHTRGYDAVYVIGDGDRAGRAFNWRVRHDLPGAMVVDLPDGDDVRGLLQRDGADPLVDAIEAAEAIARLQEALGLAA